MFDKTRIFLAFNAIKIDTFLNITVDQLDDFFSVSINNQLTTFSDHFVDFNINGSGQLGSFRQDWSDDGQSGPFNSLITQNGFWFGKTVENQFSMLYSNITNPEDVAIIKICSKVPTAIPSHIDYPKYKSIFQFDDFGEGPRFLPDEHMLYHIDSNGYESILIKIQASNEL